MAPSQKQSAFRQAVAGPFGGPCRAQTRELTTAEAFSMLVRSTET